MKLQRVEPAVVSEYVKLSSVNFGLFAEDRAGEIYAYVGTCWTNSQGIPMNSFDHWVRVLPEGTQFIITSQKIGGGC